MIKVNGIEVTKGCTVKFRCGGEAVVSHVPDGSNRTIQDFGILIEDSKDTSARYRYHSDGRCIEGKVAGRLLDIIEVIPPAFDWKDVKAGMAFYINGSIMPWIYAGKDVTHSNDVRVFIRDEEYNGWGVDCGHKIIRAPEHDLEDIT